MNFPAAGRRLSQSIANLTSRSNPLYYPNQLLLVAGCAYIGTAIFKVVWIISTPPLHGMVFITVAFVINEVISRVITPSFQPYVQENLSPPASKFLQWTTSLLASKVACSLFEIPIKLNQIAWICLGYFIAYRIMYMALEIFRTSLNPT